MTKEIFDGYKYIEGGVCAAKGFVANGLNCGINPVKEKFDLGVVYSEKECNAAGVYTQNKVKGAPIIVTKKHLEKSGGRAKAVIVNSKNANTCNADGEEIAEKVSELLADAIGIKPEEVIVASTGVIGQRLSVKPFEDYMQQLVDGMTADGHTAAADAIMTTDTVRKEVAVEFEIDGKVCHLGGMAKGSGMIHPNMATTLNFVTTDTAISSEMVQKALSEIVRITYNCLSIDGDTSTNDTVFVFANGMAENKEITEKDADYEAFREGLLYVNQSLAKQIAGDGEGCTRLFEVHVAGADSKENAKILSKSVVTSSLTKAAIYGKDANWGRILCALGYAGVDFDPVKVDISLKSADGVIEIVKDGIATDYSEDEATKVLSADAVTADIDVHNGEFEATAWGCDLTHGYIEINADYRS